MLRKEQLLGNEARGLEIFHKKIVGRRIREVILTKSDLRENGRVIWERYLAKM